MKNEIKLNDGQKAMIAKVAEFLKGNKTALLVKGNAGTGKTTCARVVAENAVKSGFCKHKDVLLIAPTHKAVDVIKEKCKGFSGSTLHSAVYHYNKRHHCFIPKTGRELKARLVICDEASMVGDSSSGRLLTDLLNLGKKAGAKIIFLGDNWQLPPVGRVFLDVWGYFKSFSDIAELTQVMRQSSGSEILTYANSLRLDEDVYIPSESRGEVEVISGHDLCRGYVMTLRKGEDAQLICWTNKKRIASNRWVRERLTSSPFYVPEAGDKALVIGNQLKGDFFNGDSIVLGKDFRVLGKARFVMVTKSKTKKIKEVCVPCMMGETPVLFFPETEQPSIYNSSIELQNVPDEFKHKESGNKCPKEVLNDDVVIATYGYAITAHKSQGSQWNTVYIGECQMMNSLEDQSKWLYTAVTRAAKKVVINESMLGRKKSWQEMDEKFSTIAITIAC